MLSTDLKAIVNIEKLAYEFPWTERIFRDCIRFGYQCWIMGEICDYIQGYGIMLLASKEAHIVNICVHPELQGCGLSRQILGHLITIAEMMEAQTAFLEVRISNERAIKLYLSTGFCEIGLRRGYYPATNGNREDGLVLAKELWTRSLS
jgi:ribosomal-protein-alanine N-acetyltransferase